MKHEKIVCAATRFKYNYVNESVILRLNYDDDYTDDHQYIMSEHGSDVKCIEKTDGFITNKNRFVDPIEAQKIAIYAGQYNCPNTRLIILKDVLKKREYEYSVSTSLSIANSLKEYNDSLKNEIEKLESGYLGYELRVEDLY